MRMASDLGNTLNSNVTQLEQRRCMLESVRQHQQKFSAIAKQFYQAQPEDELSYLEFCEQIIATIDQILASGDWESSAFLRNSAKPLKGLRKEALELRAKLKGEVETVTSLQSPEITANQVPVYIALYQSAGHDLAKWEVQLRSLDRSAFGRPVYENEQDVQRVLRAKHAQAAEAYVAVAVEQNAMTQDHYQPQRTDREGNKLVNLAPGAINPDNVLLFVHQGQEYYFVKGKLVKKG